MAVRDDEKILAGRSAANFIGRSIEIDRLIAHADASDRDDGLVILAKPGVGASELLRQIYDRLFLAQRDIIPIYFPIRTRVKNAHEIAEDFLTEFIRQLVAFRRHDRSIVRSAADLDELAELSLSVSGIWIDRLINTAKGASGGRTSIRSCFSAPARAAANGERTFIIIDDLHNLMNIADGESVLEEIGVSLATSGVKHVLSGYRRFLHAKFDCPRLELESLDPVDAGRIVETFAAESHVAIGEQSRDLIAMQLAGNALRTRLLIREAADAATDLESFENVERVYADAVFDGRIGRRLDEMFASACRTPEMQRKVTQLLSDLYASETSSTARELVVRRLQLTELEAEHLLRRLNANELIRITNREVEAVNDDLVLKDYIAATSRLASPERRASVFGTSLSEYIKRAPETMATHYRSTWSLGVRELLGAFDGRSAPTALLDYSEFRDELKAAADDEVLRSAGDSERTTLPRIFFTTAASAFYRPISQIAETERAAIALGFEARDDNPNDEVVWIAAEIDSKLEASRELAEFWCDRLEAAAVMCGFKNFNIWLIAPEGFSPAALETIKQRNGYGSSRRQVGLLRRFLDAPAAASDELAANEYEIVIPMSDDSELIAAHAVEEIARRHKLDAKSVNQIKTALIEACINASEHSLSPDRKIYQRFRVEEDRVVLTVSNRGLKLTSRMPVDEPDEGRRGWGLKLMRRLMDEVSIEQVDDGTRIVMTKYLGNAERGMRNAEVVSPA
jgi:serine/threonine-protein kinase RsbW